MKVIYTTAAREDIMNIAEWIAQDSPGRAESAGPAKFAVFGSNVPRLTP